MLKIKDILKEKNLTQGDLADKLGISRIAVVKILAGNPTVETLQKIADALEVHIYELFVNPDKQTSINCPNCGAEIIIEAKKIK